MTFSPETLRDLGRYWVAQGGVNLGVVGDTSHIDRGVSYHLGKDHLAAGAYSIQTARDKAGLSLAASAIDLGKLATADPADGEFKGLRDFSDWLVGQARQNAPGTRDMREIIWWDRSVDAVLRWDRQRGYDSAPRPGEADDSHRTHTHISWYRDAEFRDHRTAFRPYFEAAAGGDAMGPFLVPEVPTQDMLKEDPARPGNSVWIYTTDALTKDGKEVSLKPIRPLVRVGTTPAGVVILAYEPAAGDANATSTAMYVAAAGIASSAPIVPPAGDCSAVEASLLACQTENAQLRTDVANAEIAGARAEWDRQAAGATVQVELLPKP